MGFEITVSNMSCCDWKDKRIAELEAQLAKFEGINLTKISYYERNKARLNRANADKRWVCEVCNMEIAAATKAAHCRTAKHITNAGGTPTNTVNMKTAFCDVCQIAINPRTVWHHERTAFHQKQLATKVDDAPETCMPCKV